MSTLAGLATTFERILVPTDFSDISECALEYAKAIARPGNAQLFLLHVNPPVTMTNPPDMLNPSEMVWVDSTAVLQAIEERMQHSGEQLQSEGFRAHALSLTGSVQDEIVSFAQRENIDLIVLGTHDRKGFERFLFGSDAESVLRHVGCPVITIGPAAPKPPGASWRPTHVLCATALDPKSAGTAAYAQSLARQFGARLTLLTVEPHDGTAIEVHREAFELALRRQLAAAIGSQPPMLTLLSDHSPGGEIASYAREHAVDLIVMGAHAASTMATHFAHGTAARVFAEAPCPVMTLRDA